MSSSVLPQGWRSRLRTLVFGVDLPPDPVKHCKVHQILGCAHVGGSGCDVRTCTIRVIPYITPNQIHENGLRQPGLDAQLERQRCVSICEVSALKWSQLQVSPDQESYRRGASEEASALAAFIRSGEHV